MKMIDESASAVQCDLPSDLMRLTDLARRGPMSLAALHRWRLNPESPLPTWRLGNTWYVSEAEYREWVARRSGRLESPASSIASAAPSPGHEKPAMPQSARRRRQIQQAIDECQRRGC